MAQIRTGDLVRIHFTGRLDDGTVFGTSQGGDPVEFTAGSEQVMTGLSQAVVGMQPGDKKTVTVAAEDAYGPHEPDLVRQVPRRALPEGIQVGDRLIAQSAGGQTRVWVRELTEDSAVIDANHPLAGQTLHFDIEIIAVQPA